MRKHSGCEKRHLFLSFPYVCPEPVLAKGSFLYINGAKMPFSAPGCGQRLFWRECLTLTHKNDPFTKTGSGQTQEKPVGNKGVFLQGAAATFTVTKKSVAAAAGGSGVAAAADTITMSSGDLGTITVSVSGGALSVRESQQKSTAGGTYVYAHAQSDADDAAAAAEPAMMMDAAPPAITAAFSGAGEPLVVSLSFSGKTYSAAEAKAAIEHQRAATEAELAAGSKIGGGLTEAYEVSHQQDGHFALQSRSEKETEGGGG
jgi:hypothetical protein